MAGAGFASFGVHPIIIGVVAALDRFAANQVRYYNHTGNRMASSLDHKNPDLYLFLEAALEARQALMERHQA